jgi:hypothetical protein
MRAACKSAAGADVLVDGAFAAPQPTIFYNVNHDLWRCLADKSAIQGPGDRYARLQLCAFKTAGVVPAMACVQAPAGSLLLHSKSREGKGNLVISPSEMGRAVTTS